MASVGFFQFGQASEFLLGLSSFGGLKVGLGLPFGGLLHLGRPFCFFCFQVHGLDRGGAFRFHDVFLIRGFSYELALAGRLNIG